jgi:hypothetical protein
MMRNRFLNTLLPILRVSILSASLHVLPLFIITFESLNLPDGFQFQTLFGTWLISVLISAGLAWLFALQSGSTDEFRSLAVASFVFMELPGAVVYILLRLLGFEPTPSLTSALILGDVVIGSVIHGIWNLIAYQTVSISVDFQESTETNFKETTAEIEVSSEPGNIVREWEGNVLDRTTQIKHFRTLFSKNEWNWFVRNLKANLMLPYVYPFQLAYSSTKSLSAVAYSWFLISLTLGTASYLLLVQLHLEHLSNFALGIWLAVSLYSVYFVAQVAEEVFPHSLQNIQFLLGLLSFITLLSDSFTLFTVFLGGQIGSILAQDVEVQFKDGRLESRTWSCGSVIILFVGLIGAGIYPLTHGHLTIFWIKMTGFLIIGIFTLGNILTYTILSHSPESRANSLIATMLLCDVLAIIWLPIAIDTLRAIDIVLLVVSIWFSFSGFVKASFLRAHIDSKGHFRYLFQTLQNTPVPTFAGRIIIASTIIGAIYIWVVTPDVRLQSSIVLLGLIVSFPLILYDVPTYLLVSAISGLQWLRFHTTMKQGLTETNALRSWRMGVMNSIEGLWISLPWFPSFLQAVASQEGLVSVLDILKTYAKTSFEDVTVIRCLATLVQNRHNPYTILCWSINNEMLPQLSRVGRENTGIKTAVKSLVLLGILDKDPFFERKWIRIKSKGLTWWIGSQSAQTLKGILAEAQRLVKEQHDQDQWAMFSHVLSVLEIAQNAQHLSAFQATLSTLIEVTYSTPVEYQTEIHPRLVEICGELVVVVERYSLSNSNRLNGKDREWLYNNLHWFRVHEGTINQSFAGKLILFILNEIKRIQY